MRVFRKDTYLEQLMAAIADLRERYFALLRAGDADEAEDVKTMLNVYTGYRTTYAAHWYDRPEPDAPEAYIRLDLQVLMGKLPRTDEELRAALAATDNPAIQKTAMAKHRGFMGVKEIYNACWEEATTAE